MPAVGKTELGTYPRLIPIFRQVGSPSKKREEEEGEEKEKREKEGKEEEWRRKRT